MKNQKTIQALACIVGLATCAESLEAQIFYRRANRIAQRRNEGATTVQVGRGNVNRNDVCTGGRCYQPGYGQNYIGGAPPVGSPRVNRSGAISGVNPSWIAAGGPQQQLPITAAAPVAPALIVAEQKNRSVATPQSKGALEAAQEALRAAENAVKAATDVIVEAQEIAASEPTAASRALDGLPIVEITINRRGHGDNTDAAIDCAQVVRAILGAQPEE